MGCAQSRKTQCSEQERMLQEAESSLGFTEHSCFIVAFLMRKYSHRGSINPSQWEEIVNSLGLATSQSPAAPDLQAFYESFQPEDHYKNHYSAKPLGLAGILLSAGLPRQKAALIAELYDETMEGKLQVGTLLEIAGDLVELVTRRLPLLLGLPTDYLNSEAAGKAVACHLLGNQNLDNVEAVPVDEFIAGSEQSGLYTTAGARSLVFQLTNPR